MKINKPVELQKLVKEFKQTVTKFHELEDQIKQHGCTISWEPNWPTNDAIPVISYKVYVE